MSQPQTIDLTDARRNLNNPRTMDLLFDLLGDLSPQSIQDLSPLVFDAIALNNTYYAATALNRIVKARPEWVNLENENSNTPLMEAVALNRLDLVDILMDAGAATGHRNTRGAGVLDIASELIANHRWQSGLAEALLEKGKFTRTQKDRALHLAAAEGNLGMTRSLLAHGAGFGDRLEIGTALAAASFAPEEDRQALGVVAALLQAQGVGKILDDGWDNPDFGAPVHCAAFNGSVGILAQLIAAGALVNPPESQRQDCPKTPLMSAAFALQDEAIALLIKSGCDATALDRNGGNALHHLASSDLELDEPVKSPLMLKCLSLLVGAGADPLLEDADGHLPLDLARTGEHHTLANALAAMVSSSRLEATTMAPPARATQGPRL